MNCVDREDVQHIYENIGGVADEDDGWGSSEFEEYDEDQHSIGTYSQNSQDSADQVASKSKNFFRRKVPSRLSWGKPAADVQSMVTLAVFLLIFDAETLWHRYARLIPTARPVCLLIILNMCCCFYVFNIPP